MDWSVIYDLLPKLAEGAILTIQLLLISAVIGGCLALPMALMRVSKSFSVNLFPRTYIFFFRGTPLLVQLFLVYYGLGQFEAVRESIFWFVLRDPYWCAALTFSFHTAAYITEILRGAIQAVPIGEVEAARAIGLTQRQVYARIILPRALRMSLPAYGNEIILMLKASALASTVTLLDITGAARTMYAKNYMPIETFVTAGAFYLAITYALTLLIRLMEKRLHPDRHEPVQIVG